MPRRKKKKISPLAVRNTAIALILIAVTLIAVYKSFAFLTSTEYFRVKSIVIDPSLQFIHAGDLIRLKGQNIFQVDLKETKQRLAYKYPQVKDLQILRRFPNQIKLEAKKRQPFAQMHHGAVVLTLDDQGVVLSARSPLESTLPLIMTPGFKADEVQLGAKITDARTQTALNVLKLFQETELLTRFQIKDIDTSNMSKIGFRMDNNLLVYIDRERLKYKMKILSVVLNRAQIDLNEVRYVDLRFKEPVLGKLTE